LKIASSWHSPESGSEKEWFGTSLVRSGDQDEKQFKSVRQSADQKSVPQIWLSKGGGNNLLSVGTPGFGEERIWLPRNKG